MTDGTIDHHIVHDTNMVTDSIDELLDRGDILLARNLIVEAAVIFRRVLSHDPKNASGALMLASTLYRLKQFEESLHFFRLAGRLAPGIAIIHYMKGLNAYALNRRDEARQAFDTTLKADPAHFNARICRCMLHLTMYSSEEELETARQLYAVALDDLVGIRLGSHKEILGALESACTVSNFYLPYQGKNDHHLQQVYGTWFCRLMASAYPRYTEAAWPPKSGGERLRIGFVSGHFFQHSVWKIITRGWLKLLDREIFELFCFYTGESDDICTESARSLSDHFFHSTDLLNMAETIHSQKLHVLIYPGIGMDPYSQQLGALRLAPIQCVSWGHPETTGMPTMDYFLSSELMEPENGQDHYTEKLVRLPNLSVCYDPLPIPPGAARLTIPGVDAGAVTYLCCQNLSKYLPRHDDVFPLIASKVPEARFIFIQSTHEFTSRFLLRMETTFALHGIRSSDHVIMLQPLAEVEYASLNKTVDIFLDSIGWAGGNTTFESLPFNKPIVTWPGEFMRGRHASAILTMMGVTETIAADKQDYVRIAVQLAHDLEWRSAISDKIAARKHLAYGDRACIAALQQFLQEVCNSYPAAHRGPT